MGLFSAVALRAAERWGKINFSIYYLSGKHWSGIGFKGLIAFYSTIRADYSSDLKYSLSIFFWNEVILMNVYYIKVSMMVNINYGAYWFDLIKSVFN